MKALTVVLLAALIAAPSSAPAQETALHVPHGQAVVLEPPMMLARVAVSNPDIAEATVLSPTEVIVHGRELGSTTLHLWGTRGERMVRVLEVGPDADAVRRSLGRAFPAIPFDVQVAGKGIIVAGSLQDRSQLTALHGVVEAHGYPVIWQVHAPGRRQVMLQVRIAEVGRSAMREIGPHGTLLRADVAAMNRDGLRDAWDNGSVTGSLGDVINLLLFSADLDAQVLIRALQTSGEFRTLAEPNLMAVEGTEASFLAGGEFPFPTSEESGKVTIEFKEFGVRLSFKPTILPTGKVHLSVSPEVSSLDFANGVEAAGFRIPSLLARRAHSEVELRDGQTFAIAGLLDHSLSRSGTRVPVLGRLPLVGRLFTSSSTRESRTEILVLVTPRIMGEEESVPAIPTGEADSWKWSRGMQGGVR
jgi:pilus assembly protein CpaC